MKKRLVSLMLCGMLSGFAHAGKSDCPQFFAFGQSPDLTSNAITKNAVQLCFDDFSLMHSGVTKTNLWSAEHLTRDNVKRGKGYSRSDDFHPESRIQPQYRADLSDYKHSGYDRGHMSPDKDAPWSYDLDSLANMVPQARMLNQHAWADLEKDVRRLATLRGDVYVITGPAFRDTSKAQQFIGRGVMVPSHVWKVVYDPHTRESWAFIARNTDDAKVETVSIADVEQLSGLRLFPGGR